MKNAITNYENTFYFDGTALSGVVSVDGSYSLDYTPINSLGKGFLKQVMSSAPSINMSVTRFLTNTDPLLNLTGTNKAYHPNKNKQNAIKKKYKSWKS